jgi:hypothetical protein
MDMTVLSMIGVVTGALVVSQAIMSASTLGLAQQRYNALDFLKAIIRSAIYVT